MHMVMDVANNCDTRVASVKNAAVDYTIEVGTGTIEVIHEPYETLHDLDAAHNIAMDRLFKAADAEGLKILGCGIQVGLSKQLGQHYFDAFFCGWVGLNGAYIPKSSPLPCV